MKNILFKIYSLSIILLAFYIDYLLFKSIQSGVILFRTDQVAATLKDEPIMFWGIFGACLSVSIMLIYIGFIILTAKKSKR